MRLLALFLSFGVITRGDGDRDALCGSGDGGLAGSRRRKQRTKEQQLQPQHKPKDQQKALSTARRVRPCHATLKVSDVSVWLTGTIAREPIFN